MEISEGIEVSFYLLIFIFITVLLVLMCNLRVSFQINKIHKSLLDDSFKHQKKYQEHIFHGEDDKALEALQKYFWSTWIKKVTNSPKRNDIQYLKLREIFQPLFKDLGSNLPEKLPEHFNIIALKVNLINYS